MEKQVGKYTHTLCDRCEYDITEHYDRSFLFRDEELCFDCWRPIRHDLKTPYYQNHIPTFVDGGTYRIFEFTTSEQLVEYFNDRVDSETILVKANVGYIMLQSIAKSFWWVLGRVANYDISQLNIPTINYDIYDENKNVIQSKVDEWLKNYN